MKPRSWTSPATWLLKVVVLAGVYFAAAKLGLAMAFEETNASPVWPPTGVALAAILLLGYRVWPGIALGALAANVVTFIANGQPAGPAVVASSIIAAGNTLEAVAAVFLIRRFIGIRDPFGRPRDVLAFVFVAAALATTLSATIGVSGLCLTGIAGWGAFRYLWWTWWVGDAVGALVVAPVLFVWAGRFKRGWASWARRELAGSVLLFALLAAVAWLSFRAHGHPGRLAPYHLEYLVIPIILWAVFRFGQRGATTSVLIVAAIAVWTTVTGGGPFGVGSANDSLLLLQTYLGVVAVTALTLAGLFTQRKAGEEELKSLKQQMEFILGATNTGIDIIDSQFNIRYIDPEWQKVYGDPAGRKCYEYFMGRDEVCSVCGVVKALATKEITVTEEVLPKENNRPIQVTTTPFQNEAGEWLVAEVNTDITHRKKAEDELRRHREHLEELVGERTSELEQRISEVQRLNSAMVNLSDDLQVTNADLESTARQLAATNAELESFAYSVSHDLRAPLRAMDGFSLALLEDCADKLDEQSREHLDRIRAAAQRMAQLIDDLLSLSRVTLAEMQHETVELSTLAESIADELKHAEPQRRVELTIAPGLRAEGDRRLLEIVLRNLLGNAWKFTAAKPTARIEFSAERVNGVKAFFVRDDGAGFDMAYANKLFGPFQRLHTTDEFPGTGIGLATVQRVVHRHGGKVWAEGQVDKGATFYFALPARSEG